MLNCISGSIPSQLGLKWIGQSWSSPRTRDQGQDQTDQKNCFSLQSQTIKNILRTRRELGKRKCCSTTKLNCIQFECNQKMNKKAEKWGGGKYFPTNKLNVWLEMFCQTNVYKYTSSFLYFLFCISGKAFFLVFHGKMIQMTNSYPLNVMKSITTAAGLWNLYSISWCSRIVWVWRTSYCLCLTFFCFWLSLLAFIARLPIIQRKPIIIIGRKETGKEEWEAI